MRLDYSSPEALASVLEVLIFASDEPQSPLALRALLLGEESNQIPIEDSLAGEAEAADSSENADDITPDAPQPGEDTEAQKPKRKRKVLLELSVIRDAVELLNQQYAETNRTFQIIEIAGGYQFATKSEYADFVSRLFKEKTRRRLSNAALESLAIIAYKQPVSKSDVENIRGVNCDEVLKSLLEKNLITITGRAEAVGRPLLYGTTVDFLRHFGLPDIGDLPKPREIEELMKEESVKATTLQEAADEFVGDQATDEITLDEAVSVAKELGSLESRQFDQAVTDSDSISMDPAEQDEASNEDWSASEDADKHIDAEAVEASVK